ncbi:hypothetical protein LTR28_005424, partial [Elasticomyces elasticus]
MAYTTLWKGLSARQLNLFIQIFSLISIFFEGYDQQIADINQGVMGGVNAAPYYVTEVGIGGPDGVVTNTVHQGANHRGGYLGYVFIANYLGISIAYWLSFGLAFVNQGYSDIRWRFLLGFQCIPALLLLMGIKMLPDSPRYLASKGRVEEAKEVLTKVRGGWTDEVEREFSEIMA